MAAGLSNIFIAILNFSSLIIGLTAIASGVYLYVQGGTECQQILLNPFFVTGLLLFVVSLLGLIGACCRANFLLDFYLVAIFFMILGLTAFTLFVFLVTNEGAGKAATGIGFKEYRLEDYSQWLRKHFANKERWSQIRSCLIDSHICLILNDINVSELYKMELSPLQSGCCKPPTKCGFEHTNSSTTWTTPKSGPALKDSDCKTWSNEQDKLCYDCNSCKGGILANIKKEWMYLSIFNICALLLVIIIFATACCARSNNIQTDKYVMYRGQP